MFADREDDLAAHADDVVCVGTPAFPFAAGQAYRDFSQVSDDAGSYVGE